ncbi:ISAs1 family transposase [Burkholderia pyrrocinia]|uniref:ISAs1 family transposase n=1 Tax=Burkholderia pyrrocinia TaxID=60550 RepID=A0ABZ3BTX5_BURPY
MRTADKSNEITAIPELLDALLRKGAVVTIDALGCQQAIARQLVTSGADYVLTVKENQPTLRVEVRTTLEAIDRLAPDDRWDCSSEYREIEKDHGRIETRRCLVSDVMSAWRAAALWPGMRSIVMVDSHPAWISFKRHFEHAAPHVLAAPVRMHSACMTRNKGGQARLQYRHSTAATDPNSSVVIWTFRSIHKIECMGS